MAKQVIIAAMEEVFGEYILNISKDNLKIAALRGKITLENVQLDGDMIGSHVLAPMGLSSFGVLSCSAKSIKVSIPWKNLEKEPTRFEVKGVHLVCVPLTSSTAHQMYGSGTSVDPRCTLRTRAKRLVLARLERNFWNGQIPGEGPVMKRIQRAVNEVERDLRKQKGRGWRIGDKSNQQTDEDVLDNLLYGLGDQDGSQMGDLPELPRDWKVRLREKVLRNIEASIHDVHIRCEVPGQQYSREASSNNPIDKDAYVIGMTLDSLVVRTASEDWKVGRHDKRGSSSCRENDHLGPNEYVVHNNKIGYFRGASIYFDDEPPILLSESDALRGNCRKMAPEKLQHRISAAMVKLALGQEVGEEIRDSLHLGSSETKASGDVPHNFLCESLDAEIRVQTSERTLPGPISCAAYVMPFSYKFNVQVDHLLRYQNLKSAINLQRRLDTMLRQRPSGSPIVDPCAWWKYAIACVMSRPNSRRWKDIQLIGRSRRRYIELITKKNSKTSDSRGYHSGLSSKESAELLCIEDALPLEALLAFHLIALRRVFEAQQRSSRLLPSLNMSSGSGKAKTRSPNRFRKNKLSLSSNRSEGLLAGMEESSPRDRLASIDSPKETPATSLLDAMTMRLGKKQWFIDWKLHDASLHIVFGRGRNDRQALDLIVRSSGNARSFGLGKLDVSFSLTQFDVFHGIDKIVHVSTSSMDDGLLEGSDSESEMTNSSQVFSFSRSMSLSPERTGREGPDLETPATFMELPRDGSVCRFVMGKSHDTVKISLAAHPLTVVWTTSLFDNVTEFFRSRSSEDNANLAHQIRNAATPLARRAHLALLSPAFLSTHFNIAGPKVWVPLGGLDNREGTLCLDSGNLSISGLKDRGDPDIRWNLSAKDIGVAFVRGTTFSRSAGDALSLRRSWSTAKMNRGETAVVRRFAVEVRSELKHRFESGSDQTDAVHCVNVDVTPICLNLVDSESIARSFGKWYARGLRLVGRRTPDSQVAGLRSSFNHESTRELTPEMRKPRELKLRVAKLEMALEGHSKKLACSDERSAISVESFQEYAPPTRAYLIEVFEIRLQKFRVQASEKTNLTVANASIVRLRDVAFYTPLSIRQENLESENKILEYKRDQDFELSSRSGDVFSASLVHKYNSHSDEVEVDIESVVLRVTPTTLKDCSKAVRKVIELVQVATKEMERKVHEEGRRARRQRGRTDNDSSLYEATTFSHLDRPVSPSFSDTFTAFTDVTVPERTTPSPTPQQLVDSSFLIKINLKNNTVLVGRPISTAIIQASPHHAESSFVVVQVLSNALVMFQSNENHDATGTKTLHISVDNVSALVTTEFERMPIHRMPPMIEPTGAEFRVVYATESFGSVVSQDISFDCDSVKSRMTPADITIMATIAKTMIQRLRAGMMDASQGLAPKKGLTSLLSFKKKGSGIATRFRSEIQNISFVLLWAFKSQVGAPEFLDFRVSQAKALLEGCISALSGDLSATISVNFFNSDIPGWEYVVEPFTVNVGAEQMPNELALSVSPTSSVQFNVTGLLLRDLAVMKFDMVRERFNEGNTTILPPAVLSNVGLRRATVGRSIKFINETDIDLDIELFGVTCSSSSNAQALYRQSSLTVNDLPSETPISSIGVSLNVARSSVFFTGPRKPLKSFSIVSGTPQMSLLQPACNQREASLSSNETPELTSSDENMGRVNALCDAEPVVEVIIENQRLKPSLNDMYSITKGCDLLSSMTWSPEDVSKYESSAEDERQDQDSFSVLSDRPIMTTSCHLHPDSNWSAPYQKPDSPEYSDISGIVSESKERVMLPDSRWLWLNDWTVDLGGEHGQQMDSDGWSYGQEFEAVTKHQKYYQRGDLCRRRRWTRTRILRPLAFDDPQRQLRLVWESKKDENGNYSVTVRSHIRFKNETSTPLSIFLCSPSWKKDALAGLVEPSSLLQVPLTMAAALYFRIGKPLTGIIEPSSAEHATGECIPTIPVGFRASTYIRTSLDLKDVSSTTFHFLVEVKSNDGLVDITICPVFRLQNLLPCQLECKVGHLNHTSRKNKHRVVKTEAVTIGSGESTACAGVDPNKKPHLRLKVPGYKWSEWIRIINRRIDDTWRPSDNEESLLFPVQGDEEYADELKIVVRFDRIGSHSAADPLVVLLSVETGHSPTIRVYAQYWIVDKTGFGCRFTEGFIDMLGQIPDPSTSRRSYIPKREVKNPELRTEMALPGFQWSVGASGMSMFFSRRERLAIAIETGIDRLTKRGKSSRSKWISPLDVSNVVPKTVLSVDELGGPRKFELAIHVSVCPGCFGRTKLITLLPRFQIVNLLHRELVVAQDGCLDREVLIPSRSATSFHWEKGLLPPKIRLGTPSEDERVRNKYDCWSMGRIQLDRIGITALRLPNEGKIPMVIQTEVRLATKDQSSAVLLLVWSGNDKSYPLYTLRNLSSQTILCRQPLQDEDGELQHKASWERTASQSSQDCGTDLGPVFRSLFGFNRFDEYVWILKPNQVMCFGFDDPEKPHILEWTYVANNKTQFESHLKKAFLEVDAMGSSGSLAIDGGPEIKCRIKAEHSTKVIEFQELSDLRIRSSFSSLRQHGLHFEDMIGNQISLAESRTDCGDDDETVVFSFRLDVPVLSISVIDNADPSRHGREIMLVQFERTFLSFCQSREGYQEFEARVMIFQVDNHVHKSIHPVMIFCPRDDDLEPLLHISAVRRLQPESNTFVFRYIAIRFLEIDIFLDRRTAETIANFIRPLTVAKEQLEADLSAWVEALTARMEGQFAKPGQLKIRDPDLFDQVANSGRLYVEQLHLHPVRLGLTFTQEWMDLNSSSDTFLLFQFIRGMASIANAPLTFTSFVVGHVFESPQTLMRVIVTHYSSQLTKQVFGILGSLAILGAPADFISNVGNGVVDFFYEPIQGAVHGPRQFIEGLEAGTQSLARGVFVGVVRGAANVTEAVNGNLAGLTIDEDFIDERKAHQRMLTDAMSRGPTSRSLSESLNLAGESISRGLKSGILGIVEHPMASASKNGPMGFLRGVGKAVVGAVVKPIVGLGDGAVLIMKHVSDATSVKPIHPKIPKRLRRALPSLSIERLNCVGLTPYSERGAKAQKIVTGGESVMDTYLGHIDLTSHLIIASVQCFWAIDRRSREPWCVSWEEISHFSQVEGGIRIVVFSQSGLKTFTFQTETPLHAESLIHLLSMQLRKMANVGDLDSSLLSTDPESASRHRIKGIKTRQVNHVFGSFNNTNRRLSTGTKDETDLVDQAKSRIRRIDSSSSTFLKSIDEESWSLISFFGQIFSGLNSRRCIALSLINGTGRSLQIKYARLLEGGSRCHVIATRAYDEDQSVLQAGGVVVLFGWGVPWGPVSMSIETNGFVSEVSDKKGSSNYATAMPGYQVGFLEKSYDDAGWWAKYWLLVRSDH